MNGEGGCDPEHESLLADSVGLALLVVLGTLNPAERITFVLRDIFAVPFVEIVHRGALTNSGKAAREPRTPPGAKSGDDSRRRLTRQRELVNAFLAASRAGDFDYGVAFKERRNLSLY